MMEKYTKDAKWREIQENKGRWRCKMSGLQDRKDISSTRKYSSEYLESRKVESGTAAFHMAGMQGIKWGDVRK